MKNLIKAIKKSKNVALIAHISPDPDCISSMMVLSDILKQLGKQTQMFIDIKKEPEHNNLYNLDLSISSDLNPSNFDTIIAVDMAAKRLMGKYASVFESFNNTIIIDHHQNRDLTAKILYVNNNASSCCEIIFELANLLKVNITSEMATYLFAGLIGDTNCFENDNTNQNSHLCASNLYLLGAKTSEVIYEIRKKQNYSDIKLRQIMYENMVVENDVAYMIFTRKMMKTVNAESCSCDFVNELLNLENNKFSFVIKEKDPNVFTVSLRCKSGYDASKVAQIFGGGGHKQAAGCSFVGSPKTNAKKLYTECLKQINN